MIGESFDHNSNEICGSVVNIKYKLDKISLWIASGDQSSVVSEIGLVNNIYKIFALVINYQEK